MTLLSFIHSPAGFDVVMDTLATDEGEPIRLVDKTFLYASRRMVVAGTGTWPLLARWERTLRDDVLALDIDQIDRFASQTLRDLWADIQREHPSAQGGSSTIYHFGFQYGTDNTRRIIYRSAAGFESEVIDEPGFGIRPRPVKVEIPASLDEWIRLADSLRTNDEGVIIGGELMHTSVRPDGLSQRVIHRFDDFEADWNRINEIAIGPHN